MIRHRRPGSTRMPVISPTTRPHARRDPSRAPDQLRTSPGTALRPVHPVERQLGRGGMATVYLADDLKHRERWQ